MASEDFVDMISSLIMAIHEVSCNSEIGYSRAKKEFAIMPNIISTTCVLLNSIELPSNFAPIC